MTATIIAVGTRDVRVTLRPNTRRSPAGYGWTSSGFTISCRPTSTRYAIGTAANRPSAALHRVRVARTPGARRLRHDQPGHEGPRHHDDADVRRQEPDPQVAARQDGAPVERDVVGEERDPEGERDGQAADDGADDRSRRAPELAPPDLEPSPPADLRGRAPVSGGGRHRRRGPRACAAPGSSPACAARAAPPSPRNGRAPPRCSRSRRRSAGRRSSAGPG